MKTILTLLSCFILFLPAQAEEKSSKELLRDGLFEEEVNQDFSKAKAAYQHVTKRYDEERYFAGLAFFRLAEIARKSDNQEEALALYRRVASEFADQKEIAKRATAQLGDAGVKMNRIAATGSTTTPTSNAEASELQRLQQMKLNSPDLLNGIGEDGLLPLHKAAANGWTNAVDYLLESKVDVDPRTTVKAEYNTEGFTPLHLAVIHGHLSVVDRLLAAKADPGLIVHIKPADLPLPVQSKSIPHDRSGGWSSLHFSILYQRREIMTRLLKAKAPLDLDGPILTQYTTNSRSNSGSTRNTQSIFNATPLILAVWMNDSTAFQTLLDHGADINQTAKENGETPLLAAIWHDSELVPTLIEKGAKVTDEEIFGRTILHWALTLCQPPTIKLLVNKGADVNIRVTRNENTHERHPSPLEMAMRWDFDEKQRDDLSNFLIEAGAKPTPQALITASSYSQLRTLSASLKAGVDPNGGSHDGKRALHFATNIQVAQMLIEAGARVNIKDHNNVTPLGYAIQREDSPQARDLIDYFLEQGAEASVIPSQLAAESPYLGDRPLLPYVMSKTELVGKSNPQAITLAFPKNWSIVNGVDLVVPGTPAPPIRELLAFNFKTLSQSRVVPPSKSSSRTSSRSNRPPEVVTDLTIYRPNAKGQLEEIAQLAARDLAQDPAPALQWGDIVVFRTGSKQNDKPQMPLVRYVDGLAPISITFKTGSSENKVTIDKSPGFELQEHFNYGSKLIDLSKVILRRAEGESKTINLTLTHDPKRIRLRDGDTIEYSLIKQVNPADQDPVFNKPIIQVLFPDLPARTENNGFDKEMPLSEVLHGISLAGGRDLSKGYIQRMEKDALKTIPLNLLEESRELSDDETSIAKAIQFLKTPILPGDVIVFPPKEGLSWRKRTSHQTLSKDPEIGALVNLVKRAPRAQPKASGIRTAPSKSSSGRPSSTRYVPRLPSR